MPKILDPNIISSAKEKLNAGQSKQNTFEELVNEFDAEAIEIAKNIRFIPIPAKLKKYKSYSILLSSLLIGLVSFEAGSLIYVGAAINSQFAFFSGISIIIAIGIVRGNVGFHSAAGFFGGARLLIAGLHLFDKGKINGILTIEIVLGLAIFILGFYLRTKLDSRYVIDPSPEVVDKTKGITFPD
jgi:hypothetical protein